MHADDLGIRWPITETRWVPLSRQMLSKPKAAPNASRWEHFSRNGESQLAILIFKIEEGRERALVGLMSIFGTGPPLPARHHCRLFVPSSRALPEVASRS